ncbi:MAG: TatD family hydrolase [Polyangiaceae bacterium]
MTADCIELVDIGANLTHRSFSADLDGVLERARNAGVRQLVVTGTSASASRAAAHLARTHSDRLWCTAGIHPHNAKELSSSSIAALREMATAPGSRVVAIGECGLDFDRDFSPRSVQRECFAAQLALAVELRLPVFLHEREAHQEFLAILREHRRNLVGAVVHCFTSGPAELERYLGLDCHIGITGWITDPRRGEVLRRAAARIPLPRLMLETDAPFLLPAGARALRPRRNEPAFLPHVLNSVAAALELSPRDVAAQTTRTARRFFALTNRESTQRQGRATLLE